MTFTIPPITQAPYLSEPGLPGSSTVLFLHVWKRIFRRLKTVSIAEMLQNQQHAPTS